MSIFFAEEIRTFLPINLLLLLILVHIVYVLIRWYVKGARGQEDTTKLTPQKWGVIFVLQMCKIY